jgi:quercetin dioxygenase-like cupin family protein
MKLSAIPIISLLLTGQALAAEMTVVRAGTQLPSQGPAANFTGAVRVDPLFVAQTTLPAAGAYVTFEPGGRSAWHTDPLGQMLVVTAGAGRVQSWGGPVQEIKPGDIVWTPAGVKHWHGAAPTSSMKHMAIQQSADGKAVTWMEKVTDEQYNAR